MPALAEPFGERAVVACGVVRERTEHAVRAFEHGARSAEPVRAQPRRQKARARRRPGVQALGRGAVGEVLDDAAGQAARDAERIDELRRRSAERGTDPDGRGERPEHAGRMKARVVDRLRPHQREPAQGLDTHRDAEPRSRTVAAEALARGEHRRHDDRAAVHRAAFERVVEVLAVRRGAVDQGGVLGAERLGVTDRRARPAGVDARASRRSRSRCAGRRGTGPRRRAPAGRPARGPRSGNASTRRFATLTAKRSATDPASLIVVIARA